MKIRNFILSAMAVTAITACGPTHYSQVDDSGEEYHIGYGKIRKADKMGSVSKVDMKEQAALYTNIFEYLQGQVPGLEIEGENVVIRGVSSLTSSQQPLYVVDGIVVNSISDISPNIIESVEVLKDAIYTSQYGARGSNGVIVITLKK